MPQPIPDPELKAIEEAVRKHPGGVTARQIADALTVEIPHRTLQHRLKYLVDEGRLVQEGTRRWAKYHLPVVAEAKGEAAGVAKAEAVAIALSKGAAEIREYLR